MKQINENSFNIIVVSLVVTLVLSLCTLFILQKFQFEYFQNQIKVLTIEIDSLNMHNEALSDIVQKMIEKMVNFSV